MASEVDAKVAEVVMGWPEMREWTIKGAPWFKSMIPRDEGFHPSTEIEHAWLVVEKMLERGWFCLLDSAPASQICIYYLPHSNPLDVGVQHDSASMPESICRAALAALGKEA